MRYIWSVFLLVGALLVGRTAWVHLRAAPLSATPTITRRPPLARSTAYVTRRPAPAPATSRRVATSPALLAAAQPAAEADSVVAFALRQLGTAYCYAGATPEGGFDCSGFVMYVFARYGVAVPHSTALLIDVGRPVTRAEARPGDIVVFTGTATTSTTPGHAGIVLSEAGQPIRFVHSSSARRESGVKISQLAGTGYERRFMQVRRVL